MDINQILDVCARVIPPLISGGIVIFSFFQTYGGEKMRKACDAIAETVERVYKDCGAAEKLQAYKDIAKQQKLNVVKAVKYLEEHIIPTSKQINSAPSSEAKDTTEKDDVV